MSLRAKLFLFSCKTILDLYGNEAIGGLHFHLTGSVRTKTRFDTEAIDNSMTYWSVTMTYWSVTKYFQGFVN